MLFEKKMIILTGAGKGVVFIEKNGLGVKFALRTFGVSGDGLMAGVVTPERVVIRELPARPDPDIVFYIDDIALDSVHFVVFGRELVLYGAIGERMWESNLMELLRRRATPERLLPSAPPLPPIAPPVGDLPLPDGRGIVQKRLALYGDDVIAADDFYTGLDLDAVMPRLDSFLDGARVTSAEYSMGMPAPPCRDPDTLSERGRGDMTERENAVAASEDISDAAQRDPELSGERGREDTAEAPIRDENESAKEGKMQWWERQAEYIRGLSTREIAAMQIHTVKKNSRAPKKLREVTFFERASADIKKLFEGAPPDAELCKLLGGEWVKVPVDGRTVSVGRFDGALCYAVPGTYDSVSPLGDKAQWAPAVPALPTGKGYWLIFQSLTTGEEE